MTSGLEPEKGVIMEKYYILRRWGNVSHPKGWDITEKELKRRIEWIIQWFNADVNFAFSQAAWEQTVLPVLLTGLADYQREYTSLDDWADDTPIGTAGRTRQEYHEAVKVWLKRMPKKGE